MLTYALLLLQLGRGALRFRANIYIVSIEADTKTAVSL